MKKHTMFQNKIVLHISGFVLSLFLLIPLTPQVHAAFCDSDLLDSPFLFGAAVACKIKNFDPIVSIQRTVDDILNHALTGGLSGIALNSSPDDVGVCSTHFLNQTAIRLGGDAQAAIGDLYTADEVARAETAAARINCDFNSTAFGSRSAGSLLGITKFAYDSVTTERVPTSLAYYFKHNLQKVPVVNQTALAATSYNVWGLELVLGLWEVSKNIAYAMMSVIMLIIGILIITRKKINPQTVVTVQTALPRVVISLVLITFSYPLGAFMASFTLPLTFLIIRLFFGTFLYQLLAAFPDGSIVDMNTLVMVTGLYISTIGAGATIGLITGLLLAVITVIVLLVVVVKALFINIKIMLAIITAPIEFAIAAIPGQEDLIMNWIKHMIVRVLSLPAMFFMIVLAWYFFTVPFLSPTMFSSLVTTGNVITQGFTFVRGYSSRLITLNFLPLMTIMIMFMATKAEKKIEEFIVGKPKK